MSKTVKIGPIQRRKDETSITTVVRKQVNKMKLGEFFEITGVDKETVQNLRSTLSYFSKKDGFRVKTRHSGGKLVVDRVRNNQN